MHGLPATLDQQQQQIEVSRDERHLTSVADEHSPLRRERELAEAISDHDGS